MTATDPNATSTGLDCILECAVILSWHDLMGCPFFSIRLASSS